jgi:uncharacterized protein (DUF1499 family)
MALLRFAEDPYSRLAVWARRIALFALAAVPLSIIVMRAGLLDFEPGLATFAAALLLALLAILFALASFVTIWRQGLRGIGYALISIVIGVALLAYPVYLGAKAYRLPALTDISTDPADPPAFAALAPLRDLAASPATAPKAAGGQQNAYPAIEPLIVTASSKIAYDTALALVKKNRWQLIEATEPQDGRRDGRIEAVARTPLMSTPEDIVIRIRGMDEDSRIDMRSASRYGRHDFGRNATRIADFLTAMETALETAASRQDKLDRKILPKGPTGKGQAGKGQTGKGQTGKGQTGKSQPGAAQPKPQTVKPQVVKPQVVKPQGANPQPDARR